MLDFLRKIKTRLPSQQVARLQKVGAPIIGFSERLVFGGDLRRMMLRSMWLAHMRSSIRRDLWWTGPQEQLHFSTHTETFNIFANGSETIDVRNFNRAFFASQLIMPGDAVYDIGCGEGFFTKRFYSHHAAYVDAIDIDAEAIARARKRNADPKITYILDDAVCLKPKRAPYDVIVWDGAIGHFAAETTAFMLDRIAHSLQVRGVFCGSESLGDEGSDHLQHWVSMEELAATLKPHFQNVEMLTVEYPMGDQGQCFRREAYWRCSNETDRLEAVRWRSL